MRPKCYKEAANMKSIVNYDPKMTIFIEIMNFDQKFDETHRILNKFCKLFWPGRKTDSFTTKERSHEKQKSMRLIDF